MVHERAFLVAMSRLDFGMDFETFQLVFEMKNFT
jgi:hypothetical protein